MAEKSLREFYDQMLDERKQLLVKKYTDGLTPQEKGQMRLLDGSLSKVEEWLADDEVGPLVELVDTMEGLADLLGRIPEMTGKQIMDKCCAIREAEEKPLGFVRVPSGEKQEEAMEHKIPCHNCVKAMKLEHFYSKDETVMYYWCTVMKQTIDKSLKTCSAWMRDSSVEEKDEE